MIEVVIRVGWHDRIEELSPGAARRSTDPALRIQALVSAHRCASGPDHGALRRALAVELIGVGRGTGRSDDALVGLLWHTVDLFRDGDPHAQRRLGELRQRLAQRDHLAVRAVVGAIQAMLAIRAGRLTEAEALARACAEQGLGAGDVDATDRHMTQLVAIRWYQGRLVELLPTLTDPAAATEDTHLASLALAAALAGDRREAAGALARLRGRDLARLPRSSSWLVTMYGVVEAAHLLDDADTSARAYELLHPFADLPAVASLGVACFGSVQHALGVASLTTGQVDRAIEHFRAAVEGNLALGHWPAEAASRRQHAQALARRGRPHAADSRPAAPSGPAPAVVESGVAVRCAREGQDWRLRLDSRSVVVRHSVGMLHLAVLLANPGLEVPAIELVAGAGRVASPSPQPVLDRVAILEYRQRVSRLRADIHRWEKVGLSDRAAQARIERDWLLAELSATTGIDGRIRRFPDDSERARVSVTKAIRRAVTRIADADPAIGEHLRRTVQTGVRCFYQPPRR